MGKFLVGYYCVRLAGWMGSGWKCNVCVPALCVRYS